MKPMQLTFAALTTLLISLTLSSCDEDRTPLESVAAHSAQERPSPPTLSSDMPNTGSGMLDQLRAGCPMVVQGAEVTVDDTDRGVALAFTTNEGDVVDLRSRVRTMAKMYEMRRGHGGMMWHHMGGERMGRGRGGMAGERMGHMAGRGSMPETSDTVTDTDKGARLELRPNDPSQLEALREHVRWHQERMHSGECWMPQGQPTKSPQGEQE